jgi:hypothetical protein
MREARVPSLALVVLLLLLLVASHHVGSIGDGPGVLAARIPPAEQARRSPRKEPTEGAAGSSNSLDASNKKPAPSPSSSPSTVFDPDRMSKRRVRRGSDPIHNKC